MPADVAPCSSKKKEQARGTDPVSKENEILVTLEMPEHMPAFSNREAGKTWVRKIVGDEYVKNVGRTIRVNGQVLKQFFVGISLVDFHANIKPRLAKAVDVTV